MKIADLLSDKGWFSARIVASGNAIAGPQTTDRAGGSPTMTAPSIAGSQVDDKLLAGQALFEAGDYSGALEAWLPLAHAGLARAQNNVGMMLISGYGVEPAPDVGGKWLRSAAHSGDAMAQRNLATAYLKGEGAPQSDHDAEVWYRVAAGQGDAEAQDMLSWLLASADGRTPNYEEALIWARAAAAQGNAASMTRIGLFYHNALGVVRSPSEAVYWWRKSAMLGDADGQAMLGAAYMIGQGVPRDATKAFVWVQRARWGRSKLAENFIYAVQSSLAPHQVNAALHLARLPLDADLDA